MNTQNHYVKKIIVMEIKKETRNNFQIQVNKVTLVMD